MNKIISRALAGLLVLVLSGIGEPVLVAQQTPGQNQPGQSTLPPVELPENPGRSSSQQQTPAPSQQNSPQAQPAETQPSGTAVAPQVQVSGGAASKPAGVAIAPPKQRQVRSLLIKLGLLAGAGVAVGTVVGLSAASPGHVPNSGH